MKNGFDTGSTKKDSTFCKNNYSKKVTRRIFKMASNLVTCSDIPARTVPMQHFFLDKVGAYFFLLGQNFLLGSWGFSRRSKKSRSPWKPSLTTQITSVVDLKFFFRIRIWLFRKFWIRISKEAIFFMLTHFGSARPYLCYQSENFTVDRPYSCL